MINPITPSSVPLPSNPNTHTGLPTSMARATAPVPPSVQPRKPETDTGNTSGNHLAYPDNTTLEKTIEQLNQSMQAWSTGMRFDIDEDAQRIVVSIIDSTSGEVLRTVPSETVLRIAKMIVQLQGATIDTRA